MHGLFCLELFLLCLNHWLKCILSFGSLGGNAYKSCLWIWFFLLCVFIQCTYKFSFFFLDVVATCLMAFVILLQLLSWYVGKIKNFFFFSISKISFLCILIRLLRYLFHFWFMYLCMYSCIFYKNNYLPLPKGWSNYSNLKWINFLIEGNIEKLW